MTDRIEFMRKNQIDYERLCNQFDPINAIYDICSMCNISEITNLNINKDNINFTANFSKSVPPIHTVEIGRTKYDLRATKSNKIITINMVSAI